MKCPKCGQEIPDDSTFCVQCGSPVTPSPSKPTVPAQPACPSCGAPLKPGAAFCSVCGAPVGGSGATPTAPAPTPAPTTEPTEAPVPTPAPTAEPTEAPVPTPKVTATPRPQHTETPSETEVPPFTDEDYTTGSITAQEENAFLLLNEDRAANGRAALELDPALCDLARLKSRDMFLNNYFSHTSPTYGSAAQMLSSYGYAFTSVGENIAHHATVEKAQAAFMSSSGHRQNILGSQWTKMGIGVWEDSQGFVYVTQLFVR